MMIQPPIDKLIAKVKTRPDDDGGCKYTLCALIAKRARYLQEQMPAALNDIGSKSISYAAQEVYDGKIKASFD